MDRRKLLTKIGLFEHLASEEMDLLLEITTLRRIPAKQTLFRKGDVGSQLYGVMSGRLKVMAAGRDGKELVFAVMGPGDVVGEIAVVDSEPRSATVVALEKSELLSLDRRDFLPFLENHPRAAIGLSAVLAKRVRRLSSYAEDSFFLPLSSRMAKTLLLLARREGGREEILVSTEIRFAQQDLADMLGTTRESVNKQLRAWSEEGIVELFRARLRILDPHSLEQIADWTGL